VRLLNLIAVLDVLFKNSGFFPLKSLDQISLNSSHIYSKKKNLFVLLYYIKYCNKAVKGAFIMNKPNQFLYENAFKCGQFRKVETLLKPVNE